MSNRTIQILGKLSGSNNQPVAKLRVEAWDKDLLIDDFVGEAISEEQGAFTITFNQSRYQELFLDRNPDIYFKIYEGGALIHSTENSVMWNIKTESVIVEIVFDREKENNPPVNTDKRFKVQGYIRKPDGSAFANGQVYAYDKDLRTETLLGKANTDKAGYYEIAYSPDKLGKANKGNADLQVRVIEKANDKEEKTLIASEIFFNAAAVQEINLTLPVAPATKEKSEWERVNEQVLPLLKGQRKIKEEKAIKYEDLSPVDLTDTDVDFIVSETNLDRLAINAWITSGKIFNDAAQRLNAEHAEEKDIIIEYGWSFFYGLARQDVANNLDAVLQQSAENLKRAISAAIFANRIPAMDDKNIEELVKAIQIIKRLQLVDPKQTIDSPFARVLSSVNVPVSRKLALDALAIVQEKGMENPDAVLELVKQHPGEERAVNSLVRGLRINQLVNGQEALFQNLNARLDGNSDSISPLATIGIAEWINVAGQTSSGHDTVMQAQVNVEKQYPLVALQSRVNAGQVQLPGVAKAEIQEILRKDGATVEAIIQGKTAIKKDETLPAWQDTFKNLGRYLRSGLNLELGSHLLTVGALTPAIAIRYGRDFIISQLNDKFPEVQANDLVDGFLQRSDSYIKGGVELGINNGSVYFLPDGVYEPAEPLSPTDRENLPTLPGFFGDMDECMCKPCESMLGQPAYLVDLLNLLRKCTLKETPQERKEKEREKGKKMPHTGLDALNKRRKDITELPLSCMNAEKEIQHIDLVLRILEKAIVDNKNITIVIPNNDEQPISEAYIEIAKEVFPWQLPFELSKIETNAYLAKLAVTRLDLLLSVPSVDENKIAAEILNLSFIQSSSRNSISEWDLLTGKNNITTWNIYGLFPDANHRVTIIDPASGKKLDNVKVDDAIKRVSILLETTGLNLDEFEEMIATRFVGRLLMTNRQQCKTSLMYLEIAAKDIEATLNRIHRFVRLKNKLTGWSCAELDAAIVSCGGLETNNITIANRETLLVKLALLQRLCNIYGISVGHLIQLPSSISSAHTILGITASQFALLKAITGFDWTTTPFNWIGFEKLCLAADQITMVGMTIDQAAEILLTRAELVSIVYPLPASIKTDVQLKDFLTKVQTRLRSITDSKPEVDKEQQVIQALTEIFDNTKARKVVDAIKKVSAVNSSALSVEELNSIKDILHDRPELTHTLGEWFPLVSQATVDALLQVSTIATDNKSALERYDILLVSIAQRRREIELVAIVTELSGLSPSFITPLLGESLLLDDVNGSNNLSWQLFTDPAFWDHETLAGVTTPHQQLLLNWADRLNRFIYVQSTLRLDIKFMNLADRVILGNQSGIKWRNMLATAHSTAMGPNVNWEAFEALLWLQHPDHLSQLTLKESFDNLQKPNAAIRPDMLLPMTKRLGFPVTDTFSIVSQICGITLQKQLMDPVQLKKVFNILLLVRKMDVTVTHFLELADITDNTKTAEIAKDLVRARVGETDWPMVSKSINDPIRQQRRDAVVSYLVNKNRYKNANDLYEFYLIDPLVEPCLNTTKVLEAISAVQLFMQRILFGLEPTIKAAKELKEQWTWMRNYRVWEANRKVFLFPENWLYPELRDDKSSSFKQLESALGQGEVNQDLAKEAFGQFLDDVAQMGQIDVLGMYEDISLKSDGSVEIKDGLPKRRILYVIGRTQNPPYAYYWRKCIDFGSMFMEWSPWQRIELDIQGDHVMPFVLGGNFYLAWPVIRRVKNDASGDSWEVKMAWSRNDGKNWRKSSVSRDYWRDKTAAFSDERRGFAFRCKTRLDGSAAKISVYALTGFDTPTEIRESKVPSNTSWINQTYPSDNTSQNPLFDFLEALINNSYAGLKISDGYGNGSLPSVADDGKLPQDIKRQLILYCYIKRNWGRGYPWNHSALEGLMKDDATIGGRKVLFFNITEAARRYDVLGYPITQIEDSNYFTIIPSDDEIKAYVKRFIVEFWSDTFRYDILDQSKITNRNTAYFTIFYEELKKRSSRRIIYCHARIKLTATDSTNTTSYLELDNINNGTYSCTIDSEQLTLKPGMSKEMKWKLGIQPQIDNCTLNLTLNEVKNTGVSKQIILTSTKPLPQIEAGFVTTQHLYFEFDGSMYNATEIGYDLESMKKLAPVSDFLLTRDDVFSELSPDNQNDPYNPVKDSRPWINGFREIATRELPAPVTPLQIETYLITQSNIFTPTPASQFWIVGSSSPDSVPGNSDIPKSWHYAENGFGCYIDLGFFESLDKSGFLVYPDSYKEALLRRAEWSEHQSLPALQFSNFGSGINQLPVPVINMKESWTDIKNGLFTFDSRLPYACYNWEVFFHAPLMIADQLSKQHKFEDAEKWLRYVFDPTSGDSGTDAKRFLKFRAFKELDLRKQVIDDLKVLAQVAAGFNVEAKPVAAFQKLIQRWREMPFRPFVIARRRQIAFLWRTLFAYLDNLLAWADNMYRQDTRESINEAVMLYVLAQKILGRRPKQHAGKSKREAISYNQQVGKWDDFADFWIDIGSRGMGSHHHFIDEKTEKFPTSAGMLYFCMPFNDKILNYWNIMDDRLFNIRHCRNIEGIERTLALTDAPIDPELLIRAVAAGLDLADVISGLYAPPPNYRYNVLGGRAAELANEAKALGAALLSAIEKRDSERLSQLRSSNEIGLLALVKDVRKLQISEAESNITALRASRITVTTRYTQYLRLLGKKGNAAPAENETTGEESMLGNADSGMASNRSDLGLIKEENEQYVGFQGANTWSIAANLAKAAGGGFYAAAALMVPNKVTDEVSGASKVMNFLGQSSGVVGEAFSIVSQSWHNYAEQQGMIAGHLRRRDEWAFQSNQSLKELQQIDKQILANEIRIQISKKELDNHLVQIEQSKAVDEMMRSKFSNQQLYQWMANELIAIHSSTYRLALEMARTAERSVQRELGVPPLNIIRNDNWDSQRSGLLAGERLALDIKRLEIAYLSQNSRELEITKHISLRQLDAGQLQVLRATGSCDFSLPEWLFDMDFPGHYFRRIKSMSVSVPCIVGPYTGVPGTLTLLSNRLRNQALVKGTGYTDVDSNFSASYIPIQSIATSTAQNDSGLFEFNLRDERYLPFEGAGVISSWRFALPQTFRPFDYDTISDLVLHVRYTARNSGSLSVPANTAINAAINVQDGPQHILLDLRRDFAADWARMKASGGTTLSITLDDLWFPALFKSKTKTLLSGKLWRKENLNWVADNTTSVTAPVQGSASQQFSVTTTGTVSTGISSTLSIENIPGSPLEAVIILNYSVT